MENVLIVKETGSAYKLLNNVLHFSPLNKNNTFNNDDWQEVQFHLLSENEGEFIKNKCISILL